MAPLRVPDHSRRSIGPARARRVRPAESQTRRRPSASAAVHSARLRHRSRLVGFAGMPGTGHLGERTLGQRWLSPRAVGAPLARRRRQAARRAAVPLGSSLARETGNRRPAHSGRQGGQRSDCLVALRQPRRSRPGHWRSLAERSIAPRASGEGRASRTGTRDTRRSAARIPPIVRLDASHRGAPSAPLAARAVSRRPRRGCRAECDRDRPRDRRCR